MGNDEYVLGVSLEEYRRLELQHQLWASRAIRLWKRAKLQPNSPQPISAIDCGCGPGFTTLELSQFLGKKSEILAVDLASQYLQILESKLEKQAKGNIRTLRSSLESFSDSKKDFDFAYARWIFIFLKDPRAAIRNIARHLKSGGTFALQEYVDYRTMALHLSPSFLRQDPLGREAPRLYRKGVDAIIESWKAHGGDADVAQKLPGILVEEGFEILSLRPQVRIGNPRHKIWKWPSGFYQNYVPTLVREGFLSPAEGKAFLQLWKRASQAPESFYIGPMVLDIVAKKL